MTIHPSDLAQLTDLLQSAGPAHHHAYLATDGFDPDWPLWYAGYLLDGVNRLLNASFTKSELVYLLVAADKAQRREAPAEPWPPFYARFFADYAAGAGHDA